jgi:hypothetical protein
MGFSQYVDLLPGSGYGGEGIGAPIFVGRNRSLSLTLDVTDAPSDAAASVYLETAASQHATRWRKLGSTISATGPGSTALDATGADAFVRARYDVTLPADTEAVGLSLSGHASLVLLASAARAAAGTGDRVDVAQYHGGRFAVNVTSAPGGGQTLVVTVERSGDGNGWTTAATFATISAAGEYTVESADLDRFVRIRWVPSGVGSWTFGVAGTSHLIYATVRDRARIGVRTGAIPDVATTQYLNGILTATATAESYLNRYDHPLRQWGDDLRQACIALADWQLLSTRSKDPARANEGGGGLYSVEADRWTQWLRLVAGAEPGTNGRKLVPSNIVDSAPSNEKGEVKRYSFASNPNPWGQSDGFGGGT